MRRITIYEGNTILITCPITNYDGTPAVLTGYTITLHIKQNKSDAADLLSVAGVVTDSVAVFTITKANNTLVKNRLYFGEVTADATGEGYTLNQTEIKVEESIVY